MFRIKQKRCRRTCTRMRLAEMRCSLVPDWWLHSDFVVKTKKNVFLDTSVLQMLFWMIKLNDFRGELTDVSAKTETLPAHLHEDAAGGNARLSGVPRAGRDHTVCSQLQVSVVKHDDRRVAA